MNSVSSDVQSWGWWASDQGRTLVPERGDPITNTGSGHIRILTVLSSRAGSSRQPNTTAPMADTLTATGCVSIRRKPIWVASSAKSEGFHASPSGERLNTAVKGVYVVGTGAGRATVASG